MTQKKEILFINNQSSDQVERYVKGLTLIGSLSKLFSESSTPYLYYRVAEKIFCESFLADDLSRSDASIDARIGKMGVGLKTFLAGNNRTFQKVAEFNKDLKNYSNLKIKDKLIKIAKLRNERVEFAERVFEVNNCIYHCVVREENKFKIFEERLEAIHFDKITNVKEMGSSIQFEDGKSEYSFILSKSTLTKRFDTRKTVLEIGLEILKDPLKDLSDFFKNLTIETNFKNFQTVFLPLYGKDTTVFERSGLNQWNASGRKRDPNEVYIPIPKIIHDLYPDFFPERDTPFKLKLPNGKILNSKVCQDNGKALMSYSNKDLGQWILRDILKLKEGELLTFQKLEELGIDSVRVDKIGSEDFEINFAKLGSYEDFIVQAINNSR